MNTSIPTASTCLGFDYGTKQIGIAYGQPVTCTAAPVCTLKARDGIPDWQEVANLLAEWKPEALVVGLPLNMDGTESDFCLRARKFARRLHGRFGLPVFMIDERLTTYSAKEKRQGQNDFNKNPVDAEAATILLTTWLTDPASSLTP